MDGDGAGRKLSGYICLGGLVMLITLSYFGDWLDARLACPGLGYPPCPPAPLPPCPPCPPAPLPPLPPCPCPCPALPCPCPALGLCLPSCPALPLLSGMWLVGWSGKAWPRWEGKCTDHPHTHRPKANLPFSGHFPGPGPTPTQSPPAQPALPTLPAPPPTTPTPGRDWGPARIRR